MSATRVISEASLRFLLETGNPVNVQNGYRSLSLSTISSYHSDDTIEVPDILNSSESLQFCGLQPEVAELLYQKWVEDDRTLGPEDLGYGQTVICLAEYYVEEMGRRGDALWEQDDWDEALTSQGINDATRTRIMDPNFKSLRLTGSASEWALDTLKLSWEFLEGLDARLKKSKRENDIRSISPALSAKPSKAIKPSSSLTSALHAESSSLKLAIETETPKHIEGRTLLYKGGAWTRLTSIFDPDGSLNVEQILSTPPVDFHPTNLDLYFTKQWDVAKKYAGYAMRRVPPQEATVLTVAVPSSFLASSREIFGEAWKRLVWYSRNLGARIKNGGLPTDLDEYVNADVLLGNICGAGTWQIRRMKSPDELTVLKTDEGEKGTQVVLQGMGMIRKFQEECRGFVWVAPLASPKRAVHFPPT
jgi:hypothetical protein